MFSYESQREGSTFGRGDATRGFGALQCGAAASQNGTTDTAPQPQPPGGGSGHIEPPPDIPSALRPEDGLAT
jgi:hypothetical protein